MNFAMVYACPMLFICQNNHYAISVPRAKQTTSRTLAQKAFAYDMPCMQVDGNDVLAVYTAAKEAVERARTRHIPTLIECVTYRLSVHTTVDDPTKYRPQQEVKQWEKRDPIPRFQRYLKSKKILSDADVKKTEELVEQEIAKAVEAWQGQMARLTDPSVMFDHLYAEMPPSLQAQREAFRKEWAERTKEAPHG